MEALTHASGDVSVSAADRIASVRKFVVECRAKPRGRCPANELRRGGPRQLNGGKRNAYERIVTASSIVPEV